MNLNDKLRDTIKRNVQNHYESLSLLFGKPDSGNLTLAINNYNRPISYTRKEFISFSLNNSFDKESNQILAHEIAHLWWNKANIKNWEDWLNEGLAEYSSLILFREKYGNSVFKENISKLKTKIKDLPPIYNINYNNEYRQDVVTYKSAYLLYELENKIGKTNFIDLLKIFYKSNEINNATFLSLIENKFGIAIKEEFESKLKE
ncbi:hypothetical protein HSX10_18250 [Winogradskyella undariae]|uniref:M1 family aminopeptidase n=1 Tax=Winogradskyella undariae TaxID=1285465 RepID=UPI00156AA7FD|nr:M1 family aminopeptidase [Winogradskyella undariae]NRR93518.1 hypothetical protein [Winogradskyella undariae]